MYYPFILNMNKFFKPYNDIEISNPPEEDI